MGHPAVEANFKDFKDTTYQEGPQPWLQTKYDSKDEASRLRGLATELRDQDDLERDVARQVRCKFSASNLSYTYRRRRASYLVNKVLKETRSV